MKMIDLICPQCGANIEPDPKAEKAVCKYCGYQALIEREDTLEEIAAKAQSKSYGYHKGKLQAEAEAAQEQKKGLPAWVYIVIVVVVIGLAGLILSNTSKPKVNPFDYIEVSFEGTDGDGELVIKTFNKDNVDANRIHYDISKTDDLIQGESISIVADSSAYRLTEDAKTYVVEGLDEYLKDMSDIPEEAWELIAQKAKSVQEINLSSHPEAFKSMKPVKVLLLTDGERKNRLYVVHEVTFSTEGGNITCYVSTGFDGVVLRKGAQTSLDLSYGTYYGNATQTGTVIPITGYTSMEAVRADILTGQEKNMELTEKDF